MPFTSVNVDAKKTRLAKDASRWINEGGTTRKDLAELLHHQMEPHSSKELLALLFSHDHNAVNDHVAGLTMISEFYASVQAGEDKFGLSIDDIRNVCIANSDLPLKYASIKAHEPQSNLIAKNLEMVETVLSFLQSINYQFTDAEALCIVPTMIHKVSLCPRYMLNITNVLLHSSVMRENQFGSGFRISYRLLRRSLPTAVCFKLCSIMDYNPRLLKPDRVLLKNFQTCSESLAWLPVNQIRPSLGLLP
jgi:hypothetical protein